MPLVTPNWILDEAVNRDTFSYSKPDEAKVLHMCFTLDMNNTDRSLFASNVLTVERKSPSVKYVHLDVYDLNIVSVRLCEDKTVHVPYYLTKHDSLYGQGLVIHLPDEDTCKIVIKYTTSENTPGLQWNPRGNKFMMHSTFYYSFARSVIPCQDTPAVKCSYSGEVIVPAQYRVLMAAISVEERRVNADFMAYKFEQNLPVCSYHIAFAIGQFEYRDISSSTRVWYESGTKLEPNLIQLLEKIPRTLKTLEKLQGRYVWGIADILIMEQQITRSYPCLLWLYQHVTLNQILNVLARNWIGSMVSCHSWRDFWLHEAYGKFMERKLLGILTNDSVEDVWQEGLENLTKMIQPVADKNREMSTEMKPSNDEMVGQEDEIRDRTNIKLLPDLKNFNPNVSIAESRPILSEKGAILFYIIEDIVGVIEFEQFLKFIVEKYKYETLSTDEFIDELKRRFFDMKLWALDFDKWLSNPGNVPQIPEYKIPDQETIEMMANIIALNKDDLPLTKSDFKQLSLKQLKHLLKLLLKKDLSYETMDTLNDLLDLGRFKDLELKQQWLKLSVKNRYYKDGMYDHPTAESEVVKQKPTGQCIPMEDKERNEIGGGNRKK